MPPKAIKEIEMKKIIILCALLVAVAMPLAAQNSVRVAILECVDKYNKVDYGVEFQLRAFITDLVTKVDGYEGYDRVDMSMINKEHDFQRTGMVSDADIKKLGQMTGASSVVVAEAAAYGNDGRIIIAAKIIDIESGRIVKTARPRVASTTDDGMEQACKEVVLDLLGLSGTSGSRPTAGSGSTGIAVREGQDFTETAFGIDMRMIYVEGGTFVMGCTGEQGGDCENDESPTRQTTVGSFYIGMLEVTQSQWQKVMGTTIYQQQSKAGVSKTYGEGPDYPMYYVSWEEAKGFCARLSRQTGRNYRLATEAEWEYAARGGRKSEGTKYSGGWSVDDVAWYYDGNSGGTAHRCGTKRPNALGIYDMSGNVWEWCEDWYGEYLQYDSNNPKGAASGGDRVVRGGSCGNDARFCRVSNRNYYSPGGRSYCVGFRLVLVP